MPFKPDVIEKTLLHKFGFQPAENHEIGHRWVELQLPNLPNILTRVSHNRKDIGVKLEGKIARQLRVRTVFFRGMISCTNSQEDYYKQVRENPFPPWEIRF
jgi:hypothetical protein